MKMKAAIAAAAFLTMTNFSACNNFNQEVYGPPEFEEWELEENDTEIISNEDATQSETETASEEAKGDDRQ